MMEMDFESDNDMLRNLASGGTMDYSLWPLLLTTVVSRIEKTAHNDFPIPIIPTPAPRPPPPEQRFLAPLPSSDPIDSSATVAGSTSSSQETNKENTVPTPPTSAPARVPSPAASPPPPLEPGTLPPQITELLAEITGVLTGNFPAYPPHTIQRLSELVLYPKQHYRSVAAYLHAVDRVVHVTSGSNIYPLPPAIPDMSNMSGASNSAGASSKEADEASYALSLNTNGAAIGSDEALGGALLTPIPWLQRHHTNGNEGSSPAGSSSPMGSEDSGPNLPSQSPGSTQADAQPQSAGPSHGGGNNGSRHLEGQVRTESTETIEGPNGMGSIETVSVSVNGIPSIGARALTQGEILRQEQRAGVVPVSQLTRANALNVMNSGPFPSAAPIGGSNPDSFAADATFTGESELSDDIATAAHAENANEEMADEVPHARGPEEIGAADMGPQNQTSSNISIGSDGNVDMHGIDLDSAVGRKTGPQPQPASAEPETSPEQPKSIPSTSEATEDQDKEKDELKVEEIKSDGDEKQNSPDEMDAQPSPATLTAASTPTKREAEDEDMDAETRGVKRQKGAGDDMEINDNNVKGEEEAPIVSKAEIEEAAPEVTAEPAIEEKDIKDDGEEDKKDSEGDIVLSDQPAADIPATDSETKAEEDPDAKDKDTMTAKLKDV